MISKPPGLERRIRAELEAKIRAGDWPPGHRLPTEAVLMADYGCARMTVHKAIQGLVGEGLVVRNKKAGTLVAKPHVVTAVLEIPDIAALITDRGETYAFKLLSRDIADASPDNPDERALGADGRLLILKGLHIADGEPFAFERRILNLAATPEAEAIDFSHTPPGSWLLNHVPWSQARHRITAVPADASTARLLHLPPQAACLQVERWTWRNSQGVTFVRQVFPGDRYDLVAEFSPSAEP
ncbi:MAG: histidine utilization repressor [Caulobacter sp.]|nr:histidine utilization repressor [Caulobacter sp.]